MRFTGKCNRSRRCFRHGELSSGLRRIMLKKYPKIIVGAIVYNKNGEIFLARSYKWKDRWVVPGGHLEWGETIENAIRREVKEETNMEIKNIEFVDVQEGVLSGEYHKESHMVFLDYCCEFAESEIKLNSELQEYIWIKPQEAVKKLKLSSTTKMFIENFMGRKYIRLRT
ncbi:hypothetical protein A2Y83_01105 [Candidatus Falkowbacteria bacterium RBG_13_39_14]|uniref:Nudix hydrolase domain-containing protein n=1 Tax=Candidatus Falkowbacteria bacterium RBG_13_39_14 TaxID=1797985 RepID=A0A1F5S866_9BACT|nr:MAG: hypothetical protein A2Y83_01105 [Candidatus Falkowbacteria bacterium RBG_13_39_14]